MKKTDEQLMAEAEALDARYEQAAEMDARNAQQPPDGESLEQFDPVRDGWVGRDGRL